MVPEGRTVAPCSLAAALAKAAPRSFSAPTAGLPRRAIIASTRGPHSSRSWLGRSSRAPAAESEKPAFTFSSSTGESPRSRTRAPSSAPIA